MQINGGCQLTGAGRFGLDAGIDYGPAQYKITAIITEVSLVLVTPHQ
jgi:hypothetical protein